MASAILTFAAKKHDNVVPRPGSPCSVKWKIRNRGTKHGFIFSHEVTRRGKSNDELFIIHVMFNADSRPHSANKGNKQFDYLFEKFRILSD